MFCSKSSDPSAPRNELRVARIRLLSAVLISFGLGFVPSILNYQWVLKTVTVLQQPAFFYIAWSFFQLIEAKNWRLGWHIFYRVLALFIWIPFVIFNASVLFTLIVTVKVCKEIPEESMIPKDDDPKNVALRQLAKSCKQLQETVSLSDLQHSECFMMVQTIVSVIILGGFGFEMYRFIRRRRDYQEVPTEEDFEEAAPAYELNTKM